MKSKPFFNNTDENSLATKLRRQRFNIFLSMLEGLPKPVHILDVGGSENYWEMMGVTPLLGNEIQVTLFNIEPQHVSLPGVTSVGGDGRDMHQFSDQQFDIVHSNSTIEHVGSFEDQKRMADEIRRVGKLYYVQTPNRYFPIEPHFLFPFFQFLPVVFRVWMLQHFKLGWYSKITDRQNALKEIQSIRLLCKEEMNELFSEANLYEERYFGLTKSFVSYLTVSV